MLALAWRMSFPGSRRLVGHDRIDGRIEEHRLEAGQRRVECFAARRGEFGATGGRRFRRRCKRLRRALQDELPRREVVVRTVVDPEQLRVALDLRERRGVNALRVGDDLLDDAAHFERIAMLLVVEDVAAGDRGLVEMPDQRLLAQRQAGEPVRVELRDGGVVDPLEQVPCGRRQAARVRDSRLGLESPRAPAGARPHTRRPTQRAPLPGIGWSSHDDTPIDEIW